MSENGHHAKDCRNTIDYGIVTTDKRIAVLIHQATGTGKCWQPVQAMTLDEKNLFHIAVCFGRILCPKGTITPARDG